jgi:hypothetical protein
MKPQKSELTKKAMKAARAFVSRTAKRVDCHVIQAGNAAMALVLFSDNTTKRFRLDPSGNFVPEDTIGDRPAW